MGTHPALRGGGTVDDTAYVDPTAFISGSATVGARTFIGAGAFVAGGVHVGTDCIVCGGVQVLANVPNGTTVPCPPTGVTGITPGPGIAVSGSIPGPITVGIAGGAGGTDIEYWKISHSTAGKSTPPDWDRYRLWAQLGTGNSNSGEAIPDDQLWAEALYFNSQGTITDITTWMSLQVGTGVQLYGLYTNAGDGLVFPGSLIAQSPEFTLASGLSITKWSPNLHVPAGTLLHLIFANQRGDPLTGILQTATAAAANVGNGLYGSSGIGNSGSFPGPSFSDFAAQQSALALNHPYNAVLPANFPQVGTFTLCPSSTARGAMPSIAYRFVKD